MPADEAGRIIVLIVLMSFLLTSVRPACGGFVKGR